MWEIIGPPLKTLGVAFFLVGLAIVTLQPPSTAGLESLIRILAGAAIIIFIVAWATSRMERAEMPEPEFQLLSRRSEALARMPVPERPPTDFDQLVIQALDALPREFREVVEETPVIVSTNGAEVRAYGQYIGDSIARDGYPDRILIYQDTLERDFGHDPELLRSQVERVVRHELAHHLGWNEQGVRGLGL